MHTKETWLKEGRLVRVDEKAYKLVKARSNKKVRTVAMSRHNYFILFSRVRVQLLVVVILWRSLDGGRQRSTCHHLLLM